jgi:hypothetical protein
MRIHFSLDVFKISFDFGFQHFTVMYLGVDLFVAILLIISFLESVFNKLGSFHTLFLQIFLYNFFSLFFFCDTGVWTQGLALYLLSRDSITWAMPLTLFFLSGISIIYTLLCLLVAMFRKWFIGSVHFSSFFFLRLHNTWVCF